MCEKDLKCKIEDLEKQLFRAEGQYNYWKKNFEWNSEEILEKEKIIQELKADKDNFRKANAELAKEREIHGKFLNKIHEMIYSNDWTFEISERLTYLKVRYELCKKEIEETRTAHANDVLGRNEL